MNRDLHRRRLAQAGPAPATTEEADIVGGAGDRCAATGTFRGSSHLPCLFARGCPPRGRAGRVKCGVQVGETVHEMN
mgnify:CR=1 FL=1